MLCVRASTSVAPATVLNSSKAHLQGELARRFDGGRHVITVLMQKIKHIRCMISGTHFFATALARACASAVFGTTKVHEMQSPPPNLRG